MIVDRAEHTGRFRTAIQAVAAAGSKVRKRPDVGIRVRERPIRGHPFR